MVELYASQLVPCEEFTARQEELLALVSERRRKRFLRFRRPEDGQRSVLGELLVRSVICDRLGIPNEQILFEQNEHGKPLLRTFKDSHFSISHSGTWVVGAFSDRVVGVDIQQIEPRSLDVAKRFFTKEEHELILAESVEKRLPLFHELWTLKESYLKALGHGLTGSLRSFTMREGNGEFYAESDGRRFPFFFKQYELDKRYKLAVCSREQEFSEDVQGRKLDELLTSLKGI